MTEVEVFGWDASKATIKVNKDVKQWKRGKCWSVFCRNPFYHILITEKGYADRAYCPCMRKGDISDLGRIRKGQKWVHIEKGKLVVDYEE
jgi:hypothetical protein